MDISQRTSGLRTTISGKQNIVSYGVEPPYSDSLSSTILSVPSRNL